MPKFPSTLLPQTNEPLEIQKAILDLLAKINENAGSSQAIPVGTIQMYGGATAPEGFLLCDGLSYRRADYPALFSVIGTAYGAPDAATFRVPNFRGVSPTGPGAQVINGRTKTGPALGAIREDQFQGFGFGSSTNINTGNAGHLAAQNFLYGFASHVLNPLPFAYVSARGGSPLIGDDGINGPPRTGAYTHGPEIGVNFIIKAA